MVLDIKIVNHHLSKSSSALFLKAAAKPMKPRLFNTAQHFWSNQTTNTFLTSK